MTVRRNATIDAGWFEALYTAAPDPWRFRDSPYERAKYDRTLSALPRERYRSGIEVGCAIGVLTVRLAERCEALLAIDAASTAVAAAAEATRDLAHVRIETRVLPGEAPRGSFDLIVLSEVLYYFDEGDLARMAAWTAEALAPGGDVVLVHWTGETDYPLSGDAASDGFIAALRDAVIVTRGERHQHYRLDVLRRVDAAGDVRAP